MTEEYARAADRVLGKTYTRRTVLKGTLAAGAGALAVSALGGSVFTQGAEASASASSPGAVYAMTNEATGNRIMVFNRASDGTLTPGESFSTGGQGSGTFENTAGGLVLTGQSPDNVGFGNQYLFATNAGSNSISVFRVHPDGTLTLADTKPSGGTHPISITFRKRVVYVLNGGVTQGSGGEPNISGFTVGAQGTLTPIPGSTRPVTGGGAAGVAQIGFNPNGDVLVVTERGEGTIIDTYTVANDGLATGPFANMLPSIMGPFGFAFTQRGQLLCCMNRGGAMGLGAASSFAVPADGILVPISGPVNNMRSDTCWLVNTDNGKYAYVTNFQSGDLSSYRVEPDGTLILLNPIAAVVGPPESGPADQALSLNSKYLYVRVISDGTIRVFAVDQDTGSLKPLQTIGGLPPGAAIGIAAK
jgi:6-phosphogluconolactonase